MAWLTRALLLCLTAQLAIAKTSNEDAPPPAPVPNAKDGKNLAYEKIDKSQVVYTSNTTSPDPNSIPPTSGWWSSNICAQKTYCIYTNLDIGHGRGIVLLTKYADFQKIARLDQHLDQAEDRIEAFTTMTITPAKAEATGAKGKENDRQREEEKPFSESFILSKGPGLTATIPLRRGKPLMRATPVLLVHKDFFADIWRKSERNKFLEKAVSFLPPATREAFDKQRTLYVLSPDQEERTIEQILLASPFEIDLGSNSYTPFGQESLQTDHSKHYINYPSMSLFTHSCRPNIAFHIDRTLALRTTVARKVAPGEELSIAYIDPLLPRKERQEWVGKYRPSLSPSSLSPSPYCPCPACTGHYHYPSSKPHGHPHPSLPPMSPSQELSTSASSAARLASLHRIRSQLRNHDSPPVPPETIEYFLQLHIEEGLESKMAEAYELAATNLNYLGLEDDRKAKKYAELAVQAARIEYGGDANEVVAMRIMAGDVRGHWSWGYKVRGKKVRGG